MTEQRDDRRVQLLIDSIRDYAIFMLDPNGRVASWSPGAQLIKGYDAAEVLGETIHTFYTAEDRENHKPEALLAAAREHGRVEDEGWRVRKDGTWFWADVVISAIRDTNGTLVGFVKVTRDLTERRNAELDRIHLAHTQEALRLRDEFLSVASHELRTPLVALQLQIDSLRAQGPSLEPRQVAKLDRAGRNVQRLADLIGTLLDVSRIAQGKLTLKPAWIDLGALVHDVIDRLYEPAHEAKCVVTADIGLAIEGNWDPLRIGQVVSNLLSNAFKYASGSRVDVNLRRDAEAAVLLVQDRGPGIAEDNLERVFRRFERAAPNRSVSGMGLGLYLAREIVIGHGGSIRAANRDGGGARLEVRLPIRDNRPAATGSMQ